jgi:hypothetical protein
MRPLSASLAVAVIAALAGCQAAQPSGADAPPPANEQPTVESIAIDTLAAELKIPKDRIQVDSVRAVEWRDSSIGCPKPDFAYMQVITPGHEVRLHADGKAYVVHEARNQAFVCHPASTTARSGGRELPFGRQMLEAQQDLARRLGVPATDIRLGGSKPMSWSDASLGCPEPGVQYAQVVTEGLILTLRHGQREFTYHVDATRAIPCPAITVD